MRIRGGVRPATRGFGIGGGTDGPDSIYEPETVALLQRMDVEPSLARKGHINTLIAALKTAGVWAKLDVLFILAAHDAQAARLNWTGSTNNLSVTGSPTFTTDRGYTGNGTDSQLTISGGWTPVLQSQNNAHLGVWTRTASTFGTSRLEIYTSASRLGRRATVATGDYAWRLRDATGVNTAVPAQVGAFLACRANSTNRRLYHNGTLIVDSATASTGSSTNVFELFGATGGSLSDAQISAASAGSNLDDTQAAAFYDALNAYMTAVGA